MRSQAGRRYGKSRRLRPRGFYYVFGSIAVTTPRFPFRTRAAVCDAGRLDVLHSHAWGTLLEGISAAKLAGVPAVIHTEHSNNRPATQAHHRPTRGMGNGESSRCLLGRGGGQDDEHRQLSEGENPWSSPTASTLNSFDA